MIRVAVLIDGFNLYHSIKDAEKAGAAEGERLRWMGLRSLADSFLHQIEASGRKEINAIHYFSAFAHHKIAKGDGGNIVRHKQYLRVLKDKGIICHIHRFKPRHRVCEGCGGKIKFHEEKESDVAMAVKLVQIFATEEADIVVMVTGDTDMAPAVRCVYEIKPDANIWFAFPYKRKNKELEKAVIGRGGSFNIKPAAYQKHVLPDPYITRRRVEIPKPDSW